jgi:hypothetical protein
MTSDLGAVWQWDTDTFLIVVNGDKRSFYWTISDKSGQPDGSLRPFADGQAASFDDAERGLRETIGKAYPPSLGFQDYAGPLATTFMIGTGQQVDLGQYAGLHVTVQVANPGSPDVQYSGRAHVQHYDFVLTNGDDAVHITPSYIMRVTPVGVPGGRSQARYVGQQTAVRSCPGTVSRACTGVPGFLAGTVDHHGPTCPVHE